MRFIDLLSLITENLGRRKARVALTAVGVVIGTAAVVVLVSLGIGLQQSATQNLFGISDLTQIFVYPSYEEVPAPSGGGGVVIKVGGGGGGGGSDSTKGQLVEGTVKAISELPHVAAVIPHDYIQTQTVLKFGRLEGYVGITGIGIDDLSRMGLVEQSGTLELEPGTVIIGVQVPLNFYDPKLRPGQEIPPPPELQDKQVQLVVTKYNQDGSATNRNFPLRVAGVVALSNGPADWTVYMPLSEVEKINRWVTGKRIDRTKVGYQQLIVKADDPSNVLDLADQIKELGVNADAPASYVQGINRFFVILQLVFGGVGAIALLVAAIGIANTMTMAILERTREIGLMKAIGASNRDVLSVFLGEASGIGFIGGIGGALLGWGAGQIVNVVAQAFTSQPAQPGFAPGPTIAAITPIWLLFGSVVFATIIGLISGLYPALRAATLVPVLALKYE